MLEEVLQHGGSILGSVILCATFGRISQLRDDAHTLNLENCLLYLLSTISQFFDFVRCIVFEFIFYCVTAHTLYYNSLKTGFPADFVSFMYLLRVLIGSLDCLSALWLARVITLDLVLRHRCNLTSVYGNSSYTILHIIAFRTCGYAQISTFILSFQ